MEDPPSKLTVCLSHDVDRTRKSWQYLNLPAALLRGDFSRAEKEFASFCSKLKGDEPYWNFERILELEQSLGVKSTWFILNETGSGPWYNPQSTVIYKGRYRIHDPAISRILREADENGWELGLHGSYLSFRDPDLLRDQKAALEDLLGHSIKGSRQHYLNLRVPETWEYHEAIGIEYDSSLGYNDRFGHRWGANRPFYPQHPVTGRTIDVLQIPMTIMDAPWCEAEDQLWEKITSAILAVEEQAGTVTINFHQRIFSPVYHFDYLELYERIIRWCQDRGARFATLGEVNQSCRANAQAAEILPVQDRTSKRA